MFFTIYIVIAVCHFLLFTLFNRINEDDIVPIVFVSALWLPFWVFIIAAALID